MLLRKPVSIALLVSLAGCATFPASGPTKKQLEKTLQPGKSNIPIAVVEVQTEAAVPAPAFGGTLGTTLPNLPPPPTDLIGPGDILDINIYEAGVALFATSGGGAGVQTERLPPTRVDDDGEIDIPYAGKLHVAGHTVRDAEIMVQHSLHNLSQNPQVLISLSQAITNSIIISGEVEKPGRLVLQTNKESLSDVIALAGGYRGDVNNLTVRVMRGRASIDMRLSALVNDPTLDIRAYPGDRLMLISAPRSYSVLGAAGSAREIPFSRARVSLAEAIATAGGPSATQGDPAAVFLFRYIKDGQGKEQPVVYHLNMRNAGSYLLAQKFFMQDRDVLYFGTAAANQPARLIQLVSQLFSPVVALADATTALDR